MSKVKARGLRVLLAVAAAVLLVLGFCLWTPVTKTRAADGQIMTANDLMLAIYNVQDGGTVTLGADIALDLNQDGGITGGEPGGHMYIPTRETGAYSFTLDLNGNTITIDTVSGFGCIEVQSGVTVTVKNGTLAGKSNGNFACGAAGSSISLENVTIDFEGLNQEVKPAIATDGALAVSNVTFDLVNAEAIDENTAVTYQTLWDELNLAADGAVVSLKENAVLDKQFKFTEGKKLTLDLGEYTLTIGEGMGNVCALDVRSGSLTIRAGAKGAIDGTQADETTVPVGVMAQGATLTIESGTITTDTKYESCVYAGFGGIAYIKGGKFVNLCEEPFAYDQTSPALAVNVHDNTSGQQMVISGGTFVGRNPVLGDTNVNRTESYMAADAKVAGMSDGSFVAFAGEEVPEGAVAVYAQSADEVSAEVYTAEALAAALADGNFETVVLGADITASVSVERTVTLDLNGKTLKNVEGKHTIENYGTLTVIGEGTVDNVSHGRGAVVNYGTAYLNGGLYTRSLENGQNSEDSGGNSWYVLKNYGSMTIDGAKVTQDGHYSSMIANGYQNATDRNTNYGKVTTADKVPTLVIESGEFAGGMNTVKNDDYAVMTINGGTFRNVSQAAVLNWNELTITDGVFEVGEAAQAAIITSYAAGGNDNGTTTISGGTFKGAVTVDAGAAYVKYSISGGNYSVLPKAEYFAEGFAAAWNEEAQAYVTQEGTYVATIGEYGYTTLAEAFASAATGDTIKLISDVTVENTISVRTKKVTFDLCGYTVYGADIETLFRISNIVATFKNGTIEAQNVAFEIAGASGLSNNAVTFAEDLNIISENDVAVFIYDSIVLNTSANITAKNAAIMGNGQDARFPKINVLDGNITSTDAAALYLPQKSGTTTISGGTITGTTGIEIRNGTLNITGGKIVATGETLTEAPNGNGNTVLSGAAVAVSKYANTGTLKVNISGGDLEGVYTVYEKNLNADGAQIDGSSVNLSITDGKLSGEIFSENKVGFISGGNYSELPKAEYFAEGFAAVPNAEGGYDAVSEEDYMVTLTVNDTRIAYATLAEAVAAVPADNSEALIEFVGTAQEYSGAGIIVEAGQNIVIDFNNNTYIVTTTVGSSGTETNRFQLKKGSQVVMKDGTIKTSAEISGILIQKYNELTLENMVLDLSDNAQIAYVISNNNGTTTITGNTQIIAAAGRAAFDTYHWPKNGYGAVEVIFDAGFTGKVEGRIEYTTDGTDPEWQSETKLTFADGNTGTYDVDFYIMDGEENANVTVSGGTFKKQVPYELYAEGFVGVWDEEAQAYVTQEGTYVATIGEYGYTTLAEAIAAADGGTVKLIANVTENVTIEKSVTIDLNGYSISSASGYAIDVIGGLTQEEKIEVVILSTGAQGTVGSDSNNVGLNVKNFADVTVENVYAKGSIYGVQMGDNGSAYQTVVTMKDSKAEGTGFAGVYVMGTSNAELPVTLKAENSEFIGQWYGVTGNGTYHNTYIELVNCTVTGTAGDPDSTNYTDMGYGIYQPQEGTLIIDGGTVTGVSAGIEIRSGKLVVKGGAQITGTCKTLYIVENGSGTTVSGAAVAVSQHSTQKPIDVTIEEGTLTGLYALYETDTYATATPSENVEISITGGTLVGEIFSENKAGFISGGNYSELPKAEYFAEGFVGVWDEAEQAYVTQEGTYVATVDGYGYTTLAEAIAAADGETVTLIADVTESVAIAEGKTVTLDLNGKTLKNVEGKHTIENYGTLTVIGEGTVDNVSHGRGAVVNYGTAYLNGGLYTRSLENGQSSEDSGGNSWYVLKNYGSMTIDGAKVTQDGHYSSMIANGYQNAGDRNTNYGKVTTADKVPTLVIESGEFAGGINTVKNDDYAVMTINGGTFKNVSQAAVLNWNELTITDGVFEVGEAAQAAIITSYAAGGYDNGTTTISGGTFKGAVTVDAGAANVTYSISGGNYSELPKASYFTEGYAAAWDEEAQAYVTQEGSYVATIDGYGYLTLDAAINSIGATETAEIVLLQDIYLDKDWSEIETIPGGGYYFYLIQQGQNITIELNGHTLEAKYPEGLNNMLGYFFNMGTLTLKDSVGGGAMIDNSHPDMKNPMTIVLNVGTLTFESGSYRAAATFTSLSGTVTIRGGTFDSVSNGGILVAGGVLNILPDEGKEVQINAALGIRGISECEVNIGGGNFVGAPVEDMMNKNDITPDMEGKIVSVMILEKCTVNITSGSFEGLVLVLTDESDTTVSGGVFAEPVAAKYLAEGYVFSVQDGKYVVVEGTAQAIVLHGEEEYSFASVADALVFAAEGDTVRLNADVTENVTIEKSVTIDLNGYTISSAGEYAVKVNGGLTQEEKIDVTILSTGAQGTIGGEGNTWGLYVTNSAEVYVENICATASSYGVRIGDNSDGIQTIVNMKDSKAEGGAVGAFVKGAGNTEQPVTLKAENSEFVGQWYGISGNGLYHGTYIELINCTVTGTAGDPDSTDYANMGYGIYHPQEGTLIIDGGTVTGVSAGIEIRSGKLVVKGGAQITGTCKTLYIVENGNGTTVSGAAVAVSQHSTQKPIDVTIEEGTLTGLYALYETDTYATATPSENVEISITGGTLVGEIHSDNKVGFISGGRFSAQPAEEYFDPDYAAVYRDGWYVTVESTVLRVAQAQAQADVRMYAAALGLSWSDVESNAAQVIELYDAIAETFSEKAVVDAKLAAMEALEAYAEEVKAAEEEAAAAQALAQAKAAAQEEVRDYAAMLGTTWTAIANAEGAEAAAAVEKYNAIADAADTQGVADAKLAAKQAVEAYVAAVNAAEEEAAAAWAQTKQDAIAALEQWRDENAEGIVIPTSVYLAVNSAETQDELNTYIDSAKAELSDILTYRGQIAALAEDLGKQMTSLEELSATLTALDEALTGENNYFELQLTDIEEIVAKANAEIKQAVEDAQAAIVSGDADSESLASLKAYLETINNETLGGILTAVNGLGNELAGVDTALSGLSSQLSGLSGALTDVGKTIEESIAATQTKVQSIIDQLGSLATGDDITAVTGSLTAILEDIAKVQETVDAISVEVNVVTEVTEVKTQAYSDIKAWLDEYLDEIIGTDSASADVFTLRAYTPETTDGEIYAKLTKAFSEDNAKLVLKYYNEALASIDAAKTVSDVTTAVSTFKAQVASVEAAAQNTPDVNLTAVYVLLAVLLVGVVAAIVILLVRKAPAQAAVAEEAAPAPAEAKAEAEPVEEAKEAPAEEETAVSEAAAEDDDREQVVIAASVRTFSEAYEEMSEEDRDLFNKVREYALAKDDAKEVKQSTGVCVKRNGKQIVKLTIRRGAPVALFFLENEMLKDFRRATSTSAKLKVRATELVLREPADLDTAYMMVDLAVEQIEKDIENAKERRKEARRLRRLQKQAEEEAKAEDDKA